MKFFIEQIAIYPPDAEKAIAFLEAMGAEFVRDVVVAEGKVRGTAQTQNVARLAFDYQMAARARELEVLSYVNGDNWMSGVHPSVSHLGAHCTEPELAEWKAWFAARDVGIAQEVYTMSHTNPYLQGNGRKYHYCIFDTRRILGVDLKFIVRIEP